MNIAHLQRSRELVHDLELALRRAARAVTRSVKENGRYHTRTEQLQKRATAFAEALLVARDEAEEMRR